MARTGIPASHVGSRRWIAAIPLALFATHQPLPRISGNPEGVAQQSMVPRRALMPVPSSIAWGDGAMRLDSTTTIGLTRFMDDRLRRGVARVIGRLSARTGIHYPLVVEHGITQPRISIEVETSGQRIQSVDEDESYSLSILPAIATLRAHTVVGALRGLETLLELVESDRIGFSLPSVRIDDTPRFRWRGLLMDVSRHFMPVEEVKRTLDGMALVKLNVFHWHLSDDQGVRVESKRYPKLQALGSDRLYYTQDQIREVIAYARDRGIRVVPEFDIPGHSTAWLVAYPRFASGPVPTEVERHFGGSDAIFDPSLEGTYAFIERFIGEMSGLFPDPFWHVGGDEVDARMWDTPRIRRFRRLHKLHDAGELHAYFNRRLTTILGRYHKRLIGWDEVLHPNLPKNSVVQSWRGVDQLGKATGAGYASILSAPYYLDHIETAETHYLADPIPPWTDLTPEQQALVLGGEACMWAEHVSPETVDSRIWPRLAAIAERLWSPRDVIQVNDMYRRLQVTNERLEQVGLTQLSHIDRMVRRIVQDESTRQALDAMFQAVAPPGFGQRVRGQRTTQETPLVEVIDAAVPDPPGRWETSMLVDRLVSDSTAIAARVDTTISPAEARSRLTVLFTRWRDVADVVRRGAETSPLVADAVPAATALSRTAQAGLDALAYLSGLSRPAPGWGESVTAELKQYEQPQNLLRVMVVQPVERLVNAAAVNSH
jgi:hexosaminidase